MSFVVLFFFFQTECRVPGFHVLISGVFVVRFTFSPGRNVMKWAFDKLLVDSSFYFLLGTRFRSLSMFSFLASVFSISVFFSVRKQKCPSARRPLAEPAAVIKKMRMRTCFVRWSFKSSRYSFYFRSSKA